MATANESSPLSCSICFNSKEGRQPRGLPCLHSFCTECLGEWHEKRHREGLCVKTQVECPTCGTKSELPSGAVSSLPIDTNVQQFAEYLNKELKPSSCHLCKDKEGNAACLTCSVIMCKDCSYKHKDLLSFSSHVLTKSACQLHGEPIRYVCTTCLCGACAQCVDGDLHKGHSLEDVSPEITRIVEKVRECAGELEELVRIGEIKSAETQMYIQQFQCMEGIRRTLDMLRREFRRLENEVVEHERLCKAKMDDVWKEYKTRSEQASIAILNGKDLLEEKYGTGLDKFRLTEVPNEQMCRLLRTSLSSVPELKSIAFSKCLLENANEALDALVNCRVVCGKPDLTAVPVTPAPPVEVLKITCGEKQDIRDPWRLCATPEGDVIVCEREGGPVHQVYKNSEVCTIQLHDDGIAACVHGGDVYGTRKRGFNVTQIKLDDSAVCTRTIQLHDDGIAACVHGGDVYSLRKRGFNVTQLKLDGSTLKHTLKPPISDPRGLAVSDDNIFILTSSSITKQSLRDSDCRETITIEGCKDLSYLLITSQDGMTRLVVTTLDTHEVIICDEAGSILNRFGGWGSEDGLLYYPSGISRMSNGHLLIADCGNHRIVEYKMDGTFVRNLLTGLYFLRDIAFRYPYLWVVEYNIEKTLKLFRFSD